MSRIAKTINRMRKTYMIVKVVPAVFTGFLMEDVMRHLPLHPDFVAGATETLEAQRHGMMTAFMLMNKHEEKFLAPLWARFDYLKSIKKCIEEDTFGQFVEDPDYVREVVLNI